VKRRTLTHEPRAASWRMPLRRRDVSSPGTFPSLCALPLFALPEGDRKRTRDEPLRISRSLRLDVGQGARRPLRSAHGQELRHDVLPPVRHASTPSHAQRARAGRPCRIARRRAVSSPSRTDLLRFGCLVGVRDGRRAEVSRIPGLVAGMIAGRKEAKRGLRPVLDEGRRPGALEVGPGALSQRRPIQWLGLDPRLRGGIRRLHGLPVVEEALKVDAKGSVRELARRIHDAEALTAPLCRGIVPAERGASP
jgi:hypothetical protein